MARISEITPAQDILLPAVKVLERYGVSQMSLWRWERDPKLGFPCPVRIARRRYFRLSDLLEFERRQVTAKAA